MTRSGGRVSPGFLLVALALVGLTVSCTEDPLSLGEPAAPGATTDTRDFILAVSDLPLWRDTTVTGFALPTNAQFVFVSTDPTLSARALGRFDIPDTIRTIIDTLPVADFDSVNVLLRVDTTRSEFSGLPLTFRLLQLNERFDGDSVTWLRAAPGTPWGTPGGDLGVSIASGTLEVDSDTVFLAFEVDEDSIMRAWQDQDGDNGFALVVEGPTARVRVNQILLRYQPTLEGREFPVPQIQAPEPQTFIVDPPAPVPGLPLRLGGLPASRLYLEFEPPDSIDGIPLAGVTINHADLILQPLAAPAEPFAIEGPLTTRQITLLGDPFVFGPKTPIGTGEGLTLALTSELLGAGTALRLDITLLIARAVRDSNSMIRIGLRGDPDAQLLGFWEFGSVESSVAMRPQLRIVFSPPAGFTIP